MQLTIVYTDKYRLGGLYYTLWYLNDRTFKVWPVAHYITVYVRAWQLAKNSKHFLCV